MAESAAANYLTSIGSKAALAMFNGLFEGKTFGLVAPVVKESPEAIAAYNAFKDECEKAGKTIESAKPNAYKTIDGLMKSAGRAVVLNRYMALFPEVDVTVTGIKTGTAE
jgi:hypothetical protein